MNPRAQQNYREFLSQLDNKSVEIGEPKYKIRDIAIFTVSLLVYAITYAFLLKMLMDNNFGLFYSTIFFLCFVASLPFVIVYLDFKIIKPHYDA